MSDWSASIVSGDASMALVDPDTVESLTVRVTTIQFKGPISLGAAIDLEAGVAHQVEIPSVEQTGINTDASFTVEADGEGNLNDVNSIESPEVRTPTGVVAGVVKLSLPFHPRTTKLTMPPPLLP